MSLFIGEKNTLEKETFDFTKNNTGYWLLGNKIFSIKMTWFSLPLIQQYSIDR